MFVEQTGGDQTGYGILVAIDEPLCAEISMPFTPTHILAVLPLAPFHRWVPFSALVIGAMVPDTPLFIPLFDYAQTHSPLGVLTTCLPLGIAFFLAYQHVLKEPLFAVLPAWVQVRSGSAIAPLFVPKVSFFLVVGLAVIIGAYSHLLWDSFSHRDCWGTTLIPALNHTIAIAGWSLPGYKAIQYGSTILGLPLLLVFGYRKLATTKPNIQWKTDSVSRPGKQACWAMLFLTPMLVATYIFVFQADATLYIKIGKTITRSGSFLLALALVYSLAFHAFQAQAKRQISS